jgi:hypothetical protein
MASDPKGADEPVLDGASDATDEDRLEGVVEQVVWDVRHHLTKDGRALLRERLSETGITVDDETLAKIDQRVDGAR